MAREFKRQDRIAQAIHKEIAVLIHKEIKDPRLGLVTLSHVTVTQDLSIAKVYVSVLSEDNAVEAVGVLNRASGFLRTQLAKRLVMRSMPSLSFVYDDTTVRANRLSKIIDKACQLDA